MPKFFIHFNFQILYENISVPVIIAVVVAITLVILLLIFAKICYSRHHTRRKRVWKAPPTPPTPRLTQYEAPNHNPGHQNEEDPYGRAGSVSGHFSVRQGEQCSAVCIPCSLSMEYILHSNSFIRVSASLVKVFAKIRVHFGTRLVKQFKQGWVKIYFFLANMT